MESNLYDAIVYLAYTVHSLIISQNCIPKQKKLTIQPETEDCFYTGSELENLRNNLFPLQQQQQQCKSERL